MLRLLIGSDGSENAKRAVREVTALAQRGLTIEAVLCNVRPPIGAQEVNAGASESEVRHQREAEANAILAPGIAELGSAGVRVLTHHAVGDVAAALLDAAAQWDSQAIVVGRRGLGPVACMLLGSVSARLARDGRIPLMVVS